MIRVLFFLYFSARFSVECVPSSSNEENWSNPVAEKRAVLLLLVLGVNVCLTANLFCLSVCHTLQGIGRVPDAGGGRGPRRGSRGVADRLLGRGDVGETGPSFRCRVVRLLTTAPMMLTVPLV